MSRLKRCKYLENESSKTSEVKVEIEEYETEKQQLCGCMYGDTMGLPKNLRGTYLDVISLLSNNGNTNYLVMSDGSFVGLNLVKGKHLVICCLSLPFTDIDVSEACWRAMLDTYSSHNNDFEMVVAVTIQNNDKSVFDHFLSSLPCLAIPFPDLDTRHSICSFIGFPRLGVYFPTKVSAIVVNPAGIILHYLSTPTLFLTYGFEWFTTNIKEIALQDDILRFRLDPFHKKLKGDRFPGDVKRDAILRKPLSLDKDILLCPPSRVLSTLSGQSLTVSQLSKKYVGLYLCINLHFLGELKNVHDECIENKQELEIVLVCLPIYDNPKLYYEKLHGWPGIKSWYIFPYNNKVCRRLWRVFGFEEIVDRFIILPPKGKSGGELAGRTVVQHFSRMDIDAYPFTRSAILKQSFASLKSITPASLFKGTCETHTCLVDSNNNVVPQSAIKGKNLVLYVDRLQLSDKHTKLCRRLMKHYPRIQAMGCEVVYVPLNIRGKPAAGVKLAKMPWPTMPVKAVVKAWETINLFLDYDLTLGSYVNQLIALGKDGGILSTRVKEQLKSSGVNDYLFVDSLREEIIEKLDKMEHSDDEA